eukprot:ctg_840.g197
MHCPCGGGERRPLAASARAAVGRIADIVRSGGRSRSLRRRGRGKIDENSKRRSDGIAVTSRVAWRLNRREGAGGGDRACSLVRSKKGVTRRVPLHSWQVDMSTRGDWQNDEKRLGMEKKPCPARGRESATSASDFAAVGTASGPHHRERGPTLFVLHSPAGPRIAQCGALCKSCSLSATARHGPRQYILLVRTLSMLPANGSATEPKMARTRSSTLPERVFFALRTSRSERCYRAHGVATADEALAVHRSQAGVSDRCVGVDPARASGGRPPLSGTAGVGTLGDEARAGSARLLQPVLERGGTSYRGGTAFVVVQERCAHRAAARVWYRRGSAAAAAD